jgi:hypothetical protein
VASRTYSERFILFTSAGGTKAYTVPLGRRAVVRCVTASFFSAAGGTMYLSVAGVTVLYVETGVRSMKSFDEIRIVAYGGENLVASAAGVDVFGQVSGHLFHEDPTSTKPATPGPGIPDELRDLLVEQRP